MQGLQTQPVSAKEFHISAVPASQVFFFFNKPPLSPWLAKYIYRVGEPCGESHPCRGKFFFPLFLPALLINLGASIGFILALTLAKLYGHSTTFPSVDLFLALTYELDVAGIYIVISADRGDRRMFSGRDNGGRDRTAPIAQYSYCTAFPCSANSRGNFIRGEPPRPRQDGGVGNDARGSGYARGG